MASKKRRKYASSRPTLIDYTKTKFGYSIHDKINVARLIGHVKNEIINTKDELNHLKKLEKNLRKAKHKGSR